jgi:hypothetical protein
MIRTELRGEARRAFTQPPQGEFSVIADDVVHAVIAVHDVSSSGIRLRVARSLGVSRHVSVRYRHAPLDLELNGITCWESPVEGEDPAMRIVGIDLLNPTLLYSLL